MLILKIINATLQLAFFLDLIPIFLLVFVLLENYMGLEGSLKFA
jgi:hypothetical protein